MPSALWHDFRSNAALVENREGKLNKKESAKALATRTQ